MLILISIVSAIFAGMGVGGGAIFVLLSTMFLGLEQKTAQILNLILFIFVGIFATVLNAKNKNIDFKIVWRSLPMLIIGSFIGTNIFQNLNENVLRKCFLVFLVIIGIYEIITSLRSIKKAKNNNS